MNLVGILDPHGDQTLPDVDTSDSSLRLSEGTSHTSLEPISAGTRQHLVDTENVEGMFPDSDVEGVLAACLYHVLVGTDTGSLQSFRGQLFLLVRHEMHACGELVNMSPLPAKIIDPDLRVGHTTAETGLGVGFIFAVPVASSRSSTHG